MKKVYRILLIILAVMLLVVFFSLAIWGVLFLLEVLKPVIAAFFSIDTNTVNDIFFESDWIGYFGAIFGGLAGAFTALIIVKSEINRDEKNRMDELIRFHDFFKNTHLERIRSELAALLIELLKLTSRYDELYRGKIKTYGDDICLGELKKEVKDFIAFPTASIPSDDYSKQLSDLVESKYLSEKYMQRYMKVLSTIELIEEIKRQNSVEKQLFQKAYLELYTNNVSEQGDIEQFINLINKISEKNRDALSKVKELIVDILNVEIESMKLEDKRDSSF